MHTTVDEQGVATDPRVTEHARRSAFHLAVHNATELDGLPSPEAVVFSSGGRSVDLRVDSNHPEDVERWAAHLGVTARVDEVPFNRPEGRPWRCHEAEMGWDDRWHDYSVRVWCDVDLTDDEAAAYRAQQAEGS